MIDPLSRKIAHIVTHVLSSILLEAAKETGKNFANDAYEKIKNLFRKRKQKLILAEFEKEPQSQLTKESLEKELTVILSSSRDIPEEMLPLFDFMSVNAAILKTTFRSYKVLLARHANCYELLTDAKSGTDKYYVEYKKDIRDLEKRMRHEYDKIMKMLPGKNNQIIDANI
ncbi:MAG: hypothetical protein J0H74_15180 [Chitinophagaceae bacterium]|nr:hypothetical protein [Chitinophagaceae bacterium]